LGTSTGKYSSGTVEEIEEHIATGKPAMIYFSSAQVRPDSIDSTQYEAVVGFKKDLQKRGLLECFDSPNDFRLKFTRQLTTAITEDHRLSSRKVLSFQPNHQEPIIGIDAREMLFEVTIRTPDSGGYIMREDTVAGPTLGVNQGREFIEGFANPRTASRWLDALDELVRRGLVKESTDRGSYRVTHKGYQVADQLDNLDKDGVRDHA
jgi:hypothetical protein